MDQIKLINGIKLPQIGFGTWQITDRDQMAEVFSNAYDVGYRLFDTAAAYSNEIALSKAIARKGLSRKNTYYQIRFGIQVVDARRFKKLVVDL